jgi:uncharacterized membrane protein YraQ (UPF0718 family)
MNSTIIFWGFNLRLSQAVLEASLTLVIGLVVAGVLRRMVGPAGTRRLFGRGPSGLLRGWLAGMLLPVCSLGVIPVAREMRRVGVPGGTVLAFVLAAPLLNPISFLYGLTLAEPIAICCFAVASLLLSTVAGTLWDRVFARADNHVEAEAAAKTADEPLPAAGPRRLLAVLVTAAREITGTNVGYYLLGLTGSALLAAIIPFGSLQGTMKHSDWTSPLLMAAVGTPIYSSPLPGMMKIGLMFEHGNSVGAAFVLFVLGIGTNLGLLTWLAVTYRPARTLGWLTVWVAVILGLAYLVEPLLYDTRRPEIDHTHAFDDYSCPFPAGGSDGASLLPVVGQKLAERFQPLERAAVYTLAGLVVLGLLVRWRDRGGAVEHWLTARPPVSDKPVAWWNRPIPGPILGAIAIAGLIVFSVIGAYIYYPAPEQVLDDLSRVRANAVVAVRTGKREEAIRDLEQMDLLTRKLQVGVYLRTGTLSPQARKAADDLREGLEELRDLLLADKIGEAKEMLKRVEEQYQACRQAYRN